MEDSDSDSDKSAASEHSAASEKSASEKSASEKSESDKSASDKSASEKSASEKSASEKSGSEQSSSGGSGSDSGDASSNSDDESSRPAARSEGRRKTARNSDIKEAYEENPDVYGIRRSGRERKEPERLTAKEEASRAARARRRSNAVWGSSDSGSDSDVSERPKPSRRPGGGSKKPAARQRPPARRRQLSESSESGSDSDTVSRNISRRGGSRVNYQEAEEEATDEDDLMEVDPAQVAAAEQDTGETVERVLADRVGKVGATGAATTVYAVEDNGDPNADFDADDPDQPHETQYWLKWKGWSHLHNTWESETTLKAQGYYGLQVKGLKKIDNYKKRQEEVKAYLAACEPEDAEYFVCQNELQERLVASYLEVDRIIGEGPKPGHEYPDYLVKWENLPYSECTWEDGTLIAKKFEHRIDEFVARSQSRKTPTKLNAVLKRRPKFVSFNKQPSFFNGVSGDLRLRDYQLDGVNWMVHSWCRENSVILADEMGLGKTIQTTCFLYYLFNQYNLYGPYLVVVPLSTLPAWQREMARWAPEMNVVTYLGDVSSREKIRTYEWCFPGNKRLKFNVLLTSYEILLKDKSFLGAISWAALLVDEAHRLKNEESLLYKTLFEFSTNFRLLITGTPLQNSLKELWSLLHFIMPNRFDRWENFEVDMDQGSKAYARLHKLLEPFLLRRVKKDVEKSLPAKVEQILRVGMTSLQRQYYKWILTRNYTMLKKGLKAAAPSLVNVIMELKKCCNHGYLTKPPDPDVRLANNEALQGLLRNSGKLMLLDKLLVRLRERGHRVLIFSQMVRMLDLLAEYLQLRHFPFQRLDGGMRGDLRRQALDHFNAEGSQDFCFLLSTRAGGLGINLATADTVVIYDSDWNPQNDLQAQSRAHRIGQKNQVNIYRLVTMQSIEEDIIERAKRKMVLDHLVIQSMDSTGRTVLKKGAATTTPFNKDELNAILKFGAEELFNKDEEEEDDNTQCDIDLILQRAETREDEPEHAPGNELLSAFKVASFQVDEDDVATLPSAEEKAAAAPPPDEKDWDEIIPSDLREKVEEEQRQKEMEDLYLPPRSRKTVQAATAEEEDEREQRRKRRRDASDAESDSEQAKKRPRKNMKERVKGFTTDEVRRFFKAFRRFGCPMERLESIATEAELQEKPQSDLRRLGETILANCHEAMQSQKEAKDNGTAPTPAAAETENGDTQKGVRKKRECGPSFRLSGVAINAKTTLQTLEDLEPLHRAMPSDPKQRRHWRLEPPNGRVKDTHWDVDWSIEEDSRLLQGVYEYGVGAWESIKIDPALRLEGKILLEKAESKPQAKQLQTRTDYLLKILRKQQLQTHHGGGGSKRGGKRSSTVGRTKKAVSREIIDDDISSDENTQSSLPSTAAKDGHKEHHHHHKEHHHKDHHHKEKDSKEGAGKETAKEQKETKEPVKKEAKKRRKKPPAPPMHFTANHEPVQISSTEELPESVFLECKEKMRPVKRALKALDSPDPSLSDAEQVNHTRQCLIQIGAHIDLCLKQLQHADKVKEWRSNLWHFVSQFTEFDPRKLYKLYKHAVKKMGGSAAPVTAAATAPASHQHHHHEERAVSKDRDRPHHHKDKKKRKRDSPDPGGEGDPRSAAAPTPAGRAGDEPPSAAAAPAAAPAHRHGDDNDRDRNKRDRPRHSDDRPNRDAGHDPRQSRDPRDPRDGRGGDRRDSWRREYPAGAGHGSPGGPHPGGHHREGGYGEHRDGYGRDRDRSRDRDRDRDRDYRGGDNYHHHHHHHGGGGGGGGYRGWQQHGRPAGYDRHGYGGGNYGGRHYGGGEDRWRDRDRSDERPDQRRDDRRPPPTSGS